MRLSGAVAAVSAAFAIALVSPGAALAIPPAASFSFSPANPSPGQTVTFSSSSYDPDGAGVSEAWDLNGDGRYDVTGRVAYATFTSPGPHRVRLLVTDGWGETAAAAQTVQVVAPPTPPTVAFSMSPSNPIAGESVRFKSQSTDPNHDIVEESWDLNGDGFFGDKAGKVADASFSFPGSYTVGLRVRDGAGHVSTGFKTIQVTSSSIPPRAALSASPARPTVGQTVTFQSRSTDRNGDIVEESWDLDGDGQFGDATGSTAQTAFRAGGTYQVGLRVTDADGHVEFDTKSIRVVSAPVASFTFAPATPVTGEKVTFTSTSTDPDGTIKKWKWDLDGKSKTTDGKKETASYTYTKPGSYTVTLEVEDDSGTKATTFQTVTVYLPGEVPPPAAPPAPPPPPPGANGSGTGTAGGATPPPPPPAPAAPPAARTLRLLNPFPIIRIRGAILRRAARVDVLSISAERGAQISVRCRGRGCPRKVVRLKVSSARRAARIRAFERRLPAGVVLEVRVTRGTRIGKYTKFVIRGGSAPSRKDLCVSPASSRPVSCPA